MRTTPVTIQSSETTAGSGPIAGICYFAVDSAKSTRSRRMLEGARIKNATSKRPAAQTAFTMQRLWRQAVWGFIAAAALLLAIVAGFTDTGSQRAALMFSSLNGAPSP